MIAWSVLVASCLATGQPQTVRVLAAASLKEAFTEIARDFEAVTSNTKVSLSFGGSQALAAQINHGAPADVFASAAMKNLKEVPHDPHSRRVFATNRLAIVVRMGLATVTSPADLRRAKRIIVAHEAVPVGAYTQQFFDKGATRYGNAWRTQLLRQVVSKEHDVRSVLTKVVFGEADVGVVYVSDAATAKGRVRKVAIPDALNVVAEYPAAVPKSAENPAGGSAFIRHLLAPKSQTVLARAGFARAPASANAQRRH